MPARICASSSSRKACSTAVSASQSVAARRRNTSYAAVGAAASPGGATSCSRCASGDGSAGWPCRSPDQVTTTRGAACSRRRKSSPSRPARSRQCASSRPRRRRSSRNSARGSLPGKVSWRSPARIARSALSRRASTRPITRTGRCTARCARASQAGDDSKRASSPAISSARPARQQRRRGVDRFEQGGERAEVVEFALRVDAALQRTIGREAGPGFADGAGDVVPADVAAAERVERREGRGDGRHERGQRPAEGGPAAPRALAVVGNGGDDREGVASAARLGGLAHRALEQARAHHVAPASCPPRGRRRDGSAPRRAGRSASPSAPPAARRAAAGPRVARRASGRGCRRRRRRRRAAAPRCATRDRGPAWRR